MDFIGTRDVDELILLQLNPYDLYNMCYTNKYILSTCQSNVKLWTRYQYVKEIIQNVQHYVELFKDKMIGDSFHDLQIDINLSSVLPVLKQVYHPNYNILLYAFAIRCPWTDSISQTITLRCPENITPQIIINVNSNQLTTFLIKMSILTYRVYSQILDKIPNSISTNKKDHYNKLI